MGTITSEIKQKYNKVENLEANINITLIGCGTWNMVLGNYEIENGLEYDVRRLKQNNRRAIKNNKCFILNEGNTHFLFIDDLNEGLGMQDSRV